MQAEDPPEESPPRRDAELDDILLEAFALTRADATKFGSTPAIHTSHPIPGAAAGREVAGAASESADASSEIQFEVDKRRQDYAGYVPPPSRPEITRSGIAAAAVGLLVASLWLRTAMTWSDYVGAPVAPQLREASERWALAIVSGRIDDFLHTHGRVPGALSELGEQPFDQITYEPVTRDRYRLTAPGTAGPLVFDSINATALVTGDDRKMFGNPLSAEQP